jgi:hypothetical protein
VNPLLPHITGKQILTDYFQIDLSWNKWWDIAMVFANVVAFRAIFFMNIKLSESVTPHVHAFCAKHLMWWKQIKIRRLL